MEHIAERLTEAEEVLLRLIEERRRAGESINTLLDIAPNRAGTPVFRMSELDLG